MLTLVTPGSTCAGVGAPPAPGTACPAADTGQVLLANIGSCQALRCHSAEGIIACSSSKERSVLPQMAAYYASTAGRRRRHHLPAVGAFVENYKVQRVFRKVKRQLGTCQSHACGTSAGSHRDYDTHRWPAGRVPLSWQRFPAMWCISRRGNALQVWEGLVCGDAWCPAIILAE